MSMKISKKLRNEINISSQLSYSKISRLVHISSSWDIRFSIFLFSTRPKYVINALISVSGAVKESRNVGIFVSV